jgi:transcriptional regulator with XRE-family HTH domain
VGKTVAIQVRLGRQVRRRRLERGWSQERLAEKADLSVAYVSSVERGLSNPTVRNVEKLAKALGCRMGELLPDA